MSVYQRKLSDLKSLKLLCKRLGDCSQIDRINRIFRSIPQPIQFSSYYQQFLLKNTMGVFPSWQYDIVTIQVLDQEIQTEWPELYIGMKPYLQYYVIDMNTISEEEFSKIRKRDDKLVRYLIFNVNPEMLMNVENEALFIIVPDLSDDKLVYYLEDSLQMFICQVIEHLAYEILKLRNDQSNLVLFNLKEEKIFEHSKLKKRRQARQMKVIADITLMIGDLVDALEYYKQALENLSKTNDYLWSAMVHQCLTTLKSIDESEEHFRESLILLKKSKFINLEIECFFKLMHFRTQIKDKLGLDKSIEMFSKTFDPESPIEKCKFYVFVSELYKTLGMARKQALYVKMASERIILINKYMSLELMDMACKLYKIDTLSDINKNSTLFWNSLQRNLALKYQETFPEKKHEIQIIIYQLFKQDFNNQHIHSIMQELEEESNYKPIIKSHLPMIPSILDVQVIQDSGLFRKMEIQQKSADDVFIVNPWAQKEKKPKMYLKNKEIQLQLHVENQYNFELLLDNMQIAFDGCECLTYPKSITIQPDLSYITLYITPLNEGSLNIKGVFVKFMNYTYTHPLDIQLQIIEQLPEVSVSIYRDSCQVQEVDAVYFDPTEVFTYQLQLHNLNERIVDNLLIELCIEAEDPPIYEQNIKLENFKLEGYAHQTILLSTYDIQNAILLPQIPHQMIENKKISLSLFFYYQDAQYQREIKLNRIIVLRPQTLIRQCLFITKYFSGKDEEIFDLQDSCYISLQIEKKDFLIDLELKSQIILDGSFKTILNESSNSYSKVLKLRKLSRSQLSEPDLKIIWKNPFNKQIGILKPLDNLNQEDLYKHICNDLIDLECTANNQILNYTLTIHKELTNSEYVIVNLNLSNEVINTTKSVVSSIQKSAQSLIIDGYVSYHLKLNMGNDTIKNGQLTVMCSGSIPNLKVQVIDEINNRSFIKRAIV